MSKILSSLLVFPLYAAICIGIYLCHIDIWCPWGTDHTEQIVEEEKVKEPPTIEEVPLSPIMFNWSNPQAEKTNAFTEAFEQSIMQGNSPDSILEIRGFYSPNEENNTGEENLGLARAASIAALFQGIPKERIELLSKKVSSPSEDPDKLFEFSEMRWVARKDDTSNETKIVKLADREIIYFPFNSTDRIQNAELEKYLTNLAIQLKDSGDSITLTGHTDDVGDEESNKALGRSRANSIRSFLVEKGVSANQVTVLSEGENEPIATNDTERGRAKNRRVELVRN